ncbi:HNH endonuclease [Luteimonas sp. RIT-PG2_3]
MTIISQKLRESANRQKVIHASQPASLPRGRVAKECHCGAWFELPACHAERHHSCSADCSTERRRLAMAAQIRHCAECGSDFRPRPNQVAKGQGQFCSIACGLIAVRRSDAFKAGRAKAVETRRKTYLPLKGPENPRWSGGPAATLRRRVESGAAAKQLREYRKANPHKAREWAQNRKNRAVGRLEYGTLPRLMRAQRGKCAFCATSIRKRYHVDHIELLARGGRHESGNIQLLCGPCNLRKSDRDPIAFAQLNGRLL